MDDGVTKCFGRQINELLGKDLILKQNQRALVPLVIIMLGYVALLVSQ